MGNTLRLVAIVGMAGSGKSVASNFFRSKGIPVLRFGDQTDIGLKEAGLPRTEEHERAYREKIRSELGMAAMAIKIEPRIKQASETHAMVVLDGLYSWEEYIYLKGKFPQMQMLCVWAPPTLRYQRLAGRAERPLTLEEAKNRDVAEIENLHKGGPIAMADFVLLNDTDEATFLGKLSSFYDSLV